MTRLLIAAGCFGDDGHEQLLDEPSWPPMERAPLIVWRRSVPHRGEWPHVPGYLQQMRDHGYETTVLIMSRDWHAMAISQEAAPHADSAEAALRNIRQAYRHIFRFPLGPYEIVNYEALTQRPAGTVRYLFQRLGLPVPALIPDIYDGNAKYYRERVPA